MVADLARIGAVSYALYTVPRVCSCLFTRPSRESLESRVDRLRDRLAGLRENVASCIGERRFSFYSKIVATYAWISFFAVSVLTLIFKRPLSTQEGRGSGLEIVYFCLLLVKYHKNISWLVSFLERYFGLESLMEQVFAEKTAEENRQLCKNLIHFLETFREELGEIGDLQSGFHLLHLQKIPEPLFEDALLKRFICPITQKPIRYPVIDTNDNKVYEREAIVDWLKTHATSKVSSHPLGLRDLVPKSDLKAMIDMRLCFYEKCLQDYIQESEVGQGVREVFQSSLQRSLPSNQEIPRHLLFNGEQVFDVSATAALDGVLLTPKPLYERLAEFLHSRLDTLIKDPQGKIHFEDLKEIPEPLQGDPFFSRYICPITSMPIRAPLGDPNGITIYEGRALLGWLKTCATSPVTREPFRANEYFLQTNLRPRIQCRLQFHEKRLCRFLRQNQEARERFLSLYEALPEASIDQSLDFEERYLQDLKQIRQARTIEDFDAIPEPFFEDVLLKRCICPITQRPIRFIVVVDVTRKSKDAVVYERSAIMEWIETHPKELPPRWPKEVEYTASQLKDLKYEQSMIDEELQEMLENRELMEIVEQTISEWDL